MEVVYDGGEASGANWAKASFTAGVGLVLVEDHRGDRHVGFFEEASIVSMKSGRYLGSMRLGFM